MNLTRLFSIPLFFFELFILPKFLNRSSMEALGTISSPLTSLSCSDKQQKLCLKYLGSTHFPNFPKIPSTRTRFGFHCNGSRAVKMQVVEEEYELKQMKDMAAAKKRWDALIRDGKVKVLTPREAGYAIQLSNKTLLDVRPSIEHKKARVKGSTWIPIFEADTGFDVTSLSRNISNFMMGGWWSGVPSLSYNSQFLPNVEDKFEKDTDLILACQKGLRSIAACELLYNYGYRNLFWVQGGLEAAEEEDLEREGPQPFKFAGIGGVSEFLGWTDQQRAAAAKEGWGYRLVYSARLVSLVLVADAMFIGAQQIGHFLQDLRPN